MAVAEASFNTENDSISSIFSSSIDRSNPSTSTKALELAPNVEIPRIQNSETSPGAPDFCIPMIPATLPANALVILVLAAPELFSELKSTVVIAPVIVAFFCTPVPVMVTSSNTLVLEGFMLIFRTLRPSIGTSCLS